MIIITKALGYMFTASALISFMVLTCIVFTHAVPSGAEDAAYGVHVLEFNLLEGRIKLFLPDDMAAGDTVSASIEVYPFGTSPEARNNNARVLNGYTIETSFNSVPVGAGSFKLNIPKNMAGGMMKFTLKDGADSALGSSSVPVKLSSPPGRSAEVPTPFDYQCPLAGRVGRVVEIKGPFDGDFATTDFQIDGRKPLVLAESPRKLVFETPSDVAGPAELVLKEREVVVKRPFTCLQVVKIGEEGAVPVSPRTREGFVSGEAPPQSVEFAYSGGEIEERGTGPMQKLEFESIKAEETLSPVTQNDTGSQASEARASAEGIGAVLARQMSSSFNGGASGAEEVTVSETVLTAEVEAPGAGAVYEEEISERSYEVIAEYGGDVKGEREVAEVSSVPALLSPAEKDLTAEVIQSQLEAPFAGASSTMRSDVPPPSRLEGGFTVQAASFKRVEDAERLAGELVGKGYPAFVAPADIPGRGKWYRVRVGTFPTRHEADVFGDYLKKKEPLVKSVFTAENHQ